MLEWVGGRGVEEDFFQMQQKEAIWQPNIEITVFFKRKKIVNIFGFSWTKTSKDLTCVKRPSSVSSVSSVLKRKKVLSGAIVGSTRIFDYEFFRHTIENSFFCFSSSYCLIGYVISRTQSARFPHEEDFYDFWELILPMYRDLNWFSVSRTFNFG